MMFNLQISVGATYVKSTRSDNEVRVDDAPQDKKEIKRKKKGGGEKKDMHENQLLPSVTLTISIEFILCPWPWQKA